MAVHVYVDERLYGIWTLGLTDFCSFEKTIFCFKIGKNAG